MKTSAQNKRNDQHSSIPYLSQDFDKSQQALIDLRQEIPFNPKNLNQDFYKICNRRHKNQYSIKHGYKVFTITREEQDLVRFCFGLLQYDVKFPLKSLFHLQKSTQSRQCYDIWLETQFYVSGNTLERDSELENQQFQKNIYKFFKNTILPILIEFKNNMINWEYMTSSEYKDENVIEQFKEKIIKQCNYDFKKMCETPS